MVAGFEFNLNTASLNPWHRTRIVTLISSPPITLCTTSPTYNVTGSASAQLTDYATIRGRLGWAYQNFLPYVFFGASIARVTWSSAANVNYFGTPDASVPNQSLWNIGANWTQVDGGNNKFSYGYDVGIGLDYALTQNVFSAW